MNYHEYIHSEKWRQKKKRLKADSCDKCGFRHELDLHHLNYDCLGKETESDVTTLCRRCHRDLHYEQRRGMASETMIRKQYIITQKEFEEHKLFVAKAG